jgi:hypothetical protein
MTDIINLTEGDDTYTVTAAGMTINALSGNDRIVSTFDNTTINGGGGNTLVNQKKLADEYEITGNRSAITSRDGRAELNIYGDQNAITSEETSANVFSSLTGLIVGNGNVTTLSRADYASLAITGNENVAAVRLGSYDVSIQIAGNQIL